MNLGLGNWNYLWCSCFRWTVIVQIATCVSFIGSYFSMLQQRNRSQWIVSLVKMMIWVMLIMSFSVGFREALTLQLLHISHLIVMPGLSDWQERGDKINPILLTGTWTWTWSGNFAIPPQGLPARQFWPNKEWWVIINDSKFQRAWARTLQATASWHAGKLPGLENPHCDHPISKRRLW